MTRPLGQHLPLPSLSKRIAIMKTKFTIGQFSRLTQVTVKTLRFYEQKSLLLPDEVDEWTGYRYYTVGQMQRLKTIRNLQRLGFSLDEVTALFEEQSQTPTIPQLDAKIAEVDQRLKELTARRNQLLHWKNYLTSITLMQTISLQSLPSIIVASHRTIIPNYEALGPLCCQTIGPEMQRLGCKCPPPGYCFTIEHNEEYSPTHIDIEYCEQVEEMGHDSSIIQFKRLHAVEKALCLKHYGPYDRFYESYTALFKYMEDHGLTAIGHPRCSYVDGIWNQADPEKWLSFIQQPVA